MKILIFLFIIYILINMFKKIRIGKKSDHDENIIDVDYEEIE